MLVCWISDLLSTLADVWNFPLYLNNILRTNRKRWDIFKMRHHFCKVVINKRAVRHFNSTWQLKSLTFERRNWKRTESISHSKNIILKLLVYAKSVSTVCYCIRNIKRRLEKKRKKRTNSRVIVFLNANITVSDKQSWKIQQEIHSSCCNHNSTVNVS